MKNLLFSLLVITVFFGAIEFILAALGVTPVLLTEDPLVGFAENIPQFSETIRPDGSVILKTANNKRGLFNYQEFTKAKDSNSYRIFCMGGSTTYGRPYADNVSFCGWLREYLNAADPARNWEVINAGGISFASYRVAKLMNELKQYQPDLFIVYSGQNEFLEARSYGGLIDLPAWVVNINATLSGTRIYTVMMNLIDVVKSDSLQQAKQRYRLSGEVEEVLNYTVGPESYHRDDALKRQIITHYRLNLIRMVRIARSVDAGILLVQPVINLKDMSPFKSEHKQGLDGQTLLDWDALYQHATALDEAGNAGEALVIYRQALEIDDRYADIHYRIGKALFKLGKYDEAEEAFRRAVDEDIAPLRMLSSMQRIIEEVASAEKVPLVDFPAIMRRAYLALYDHAVFGKEYFPDHVHTNMQGYRLLGFALFEHLVSENIVIPDDSWNDARAEAVEQEVLARLDPRVEGHAFMNLGKVLDWAGKFEEACELFSRALAILGPNPIIYDRLARCSYSLGNHDKAIHYLNEIQAVAPEITGVHSRLAMIYKQQNEFDKAITHCRAELALDADDHRVHAALAKLLENKEDDTAARLHYEIALQLEPEYEYARVELAYLLIRQAQYAEALLHAQEALRINPKQFRAHNALGLIVKNQGNPEQAIHHFKAALRLEPGYSIAEENLLQVETEHNKAGSGDDPPSGRVND